MTGRYKFVELNHVIEDGMAAYPGLPSPEIGAVADHAQSRPRYDGKAEFFLSLVKMSGNTGTYLDSPFHRYADGDDLSRLPLDSVAGLPGLVLDGVVSPSREVDVNCDDSELAGQAVLIRTGWDERWGTAGYWEPGPFLCSGLIDRLIRSSATLVGVDFWNVDDIADLARPAHTRLLGAGVLIVEHMANLGALPRDGFRFYAVPLRIVRGASFPVRAFAEVDRRR
jgi:kynurenine formamidase